VRRWQQAFPVILSLEPMPHSPLLIASGLDTDRFLYVGFLAAKPATRRNGVEALALACLGSTLVVMRGSASHPGNAADVEAVWGGPCACGLARDLTNSTEEFLRGSAREVRLCWRPANVYGARWCFLIDAAPWPSQPNAGGSVAQQVSQLMDGRGFGKKDAPQAGRA